MVDNTHLAVNNDIGEDVDNLDRRGNNNTQEDELEVLFDGTNEGNDDADLIGFASVLFLTVNATLGAGMLTIPYAFNQNGGLINSSIFQFFHMLVVILSLVVLSLGAEISKTDSFKNVVHHFCGQWCGSLNSIIVILYSFGSCVTYIIITGDQFDKFFSTFYGPSFEQHFYMTRGFLMTILSVVGIAPLCYSKDISFLKFASFIGFCSTVYICILVQMKWMMGTTKLEHKLLSSSSIEKWIDPLMVSSVLTFSYQCQLSWVPTYARIRNRTSSYARITMMAFVSMFVCGFSYTWVAIFGILTFGSALEKDIMQNYDPRDAMVATGMALLIIKSVVIYPILLFVGRKVIEDWMGSLYDAQSVVCGRWPTSTVVRSIIATTWVGGTCLLAVFVPNIAVAIHYLGLLANLFVFILPGMVCYSIALDEQKVAKVRMLMRLPSCLVHRVSMLSVSLLLIGYGFFTLYVSILQTLSAQFE